MCRQDVADGRRRTPLISRQTTVGPGRVRLVNDNARRVAIAFQVSAHIITQPQTAGIGVISLDNGNTSIVNKFFYLYDSYILYRIEDYGSIVTGSWDFISGDAGTLNLSVLEIIAEDELDAAVQKE